jgi:hypothetical protein
MLIGKNSHYLVWEKCDHNLYLHSPFLSSLPFYSFHSSSSNDSITLPGISCLLDLFWLIPLSCNAVFSSLDVQFTLRILLKNFFSVSQRTLYPWKSEEMDRVDKSGHLVFVV